MNNKLMAPLWLMYPNIPEGSIGWRMGYGENYADEYYKWFYSLTDEQKREYNKKFPKPVCWYLSNQIHHDSFWTYQWKSNNLPEYSVDTVKEEMEAGIEREKIFFWGHHSSDNGVIGKECLSQWYMSDFYVGHIKYCCMEQYMMSKKALLFGDDETNKKIMEAADQKTIKQLGREVKAFDEEIWNKFKRPIVLTGSYYKFSQHDRLRRYLLGTGEALLAEASPYDTIWGIGMDAKEASRCTVNEWRGTNLLGFALMEVRDELARIWRHENEIDFCDLHERFD